MDKQKKINRYQRLYSQIEELLKKSDDETAHMATVSAVLFNKMEYFFWCGFYRIVNGELIVGAYQGPVACQILAKNKGVCWTSVNQGKTIVVPYKDKTGKITAVLDVDSSEFNSFDEVDAEYLEKIVALI